MRVVFMGTPTFAVPSLQALAERSDVQVTLVVSQPDRPAGRGAKLTSPPVVQAARALGIPVWQPEHLKTDEAWQRLVDEAPDLMVVAAYGEILRQRVLDVPPKGCINVHASLLPRWRGAAPIQWSVAAGDAVAGVSIMRMERGLDTGPVYGMEAVMIGETETSGELHDRLAALGARLLTRLLPDIVAGATPVPQNPARTSYARMLSRADRNLPLDSAAAAAHWINGMSPWPGVAVQVQGDRLAVLRARATREATSDAAGTLRVVDGRLLLACADGFLAEWLEVQRPGRNVVSGREFVRGAAVDGVRIAEATA